MPPKTEANITASPARHRAPLLWIVLPFIAGLGAASGGGALTMGPALAAGTLVAVGGVFVAADAALWAFGMSFAGYVAGNVSYQLNHPAAPDPAAWASPKAEVLVLKVESATPGRAGRTGGLGRVISAAPDNALEDERVYFSVLGRPGQTAPIRTAVIELAGRVRRVPAHPPVDSFYGYLAGLGIEFELSPARLVAERRSPTRWARFCDRLAGRMSGLLGRGFERRPDLAALYRAMMLGRKGDLTAAQKARFIASGTMHLFAINGLHIGLVALTLHALLALLRCPRPVAAALVLAVLWIDVDSTGASPSAVRAFLMIAVLETGHALALPANPLSALAAAALAVLLAHPLDFFGASFRMSFSVVLALITLGTPLSAQWSGRSGWAVPRHLRAAAAFCAAAGAVSAVTGVEYFSVWAPSGLLANLVLVPAATLVIVSGFASIAAGLLHLYALTRLFNGAAFVLLRAISAATALIASIPGASFPARFRADWIGPAALAGLMGACLGGYAAGWRRRAGGAWPPFVLAALVLALGVVYGG